MKYKILLVSLLGALSFSALAQDVISHKSPYCGCCGAWAKHMQENGFNVKEQKHEDMMETSASICRHF